ncbi:hypothetical protein ACSC89_003416 [Salmonella enterica subsp. enterica]|nr:hypothetical protein [Salmonella enterica subsp. enterica serovar Llandoff]ECG5099406.1 hypothetical protein [Salmonella enterica subsp. enterica]EEE6744504.1 hypothetical protein [Salmonella enterica subsp. enterica serovar Westhampton]EEH9715122.1 hypothetical protein [Salmonella enterica subsp. enterica serovar Vancouver]EHA4611303.1 hypothetical protein [Salmonella enterica]
MNTAIKQDRITLKNLKVAEFTSDDTLCFSATIIFDGVAIAEASNDGSGGMTFIHAPKDKRAQLSEAETFAKSLPPQICPDLPPIDGKPFSIDITLDYLVDVLANALHEDRKLRTTYSRSKNKVMFIKDNKISVVQKVKLDSLEDRPAFFASLRKSCGPSIIILAELPPDEAFTLWKQHIYESN